MNKPRQINIQEQVLEKIKAGQVKMKSKIVFALRKMSLKGSFGILMALSVFVFSLIIFFIGQQSSTQALSLGGKGFSIFWSELPFSWLAFVIILILIATLIYRRYTLAYRKPLKHSLTTMAVVVILVGTLFSLTGFHQGMAAKAASYDSGFLHSVYRRAISCDFDNDYMVIGKVISIDRESRKVEAFTRGHLPVTVQLFSDTRIRRAPKVEDTFIAIGYKEGSTFYAEGISKITLSAIKNRCLAEGKLRGN